MDKPFTTFANAVSRWTGRPLAFVICILLVITWAVSGPAFRFSDTWQLVINTSTTIITFLMVFLIQNTQNRDNAALQVKLDELIRVSAAHNRFIGVEKMTDKDLESLLDNIEEGARESGDTEATAKAADATRAKLAKSSKAGGGSKKKTATKSPPKRQAAPRRRKATS